MAHSGLAYSRDDEYETQLYGFCQKDLIEHLRCSMLENFIKTVDALKSNLVETQKTDEGKAAAEKICNNLLEKWSEASTAPIDRLQQQLHGFLGLPPHILLREDEPQRKRYTPEDEMNVKSEIDRVNSRFRRAQYLKKCYEEELEKAKHVESRTELFQRTLSFLENPKILAKAAKSKELHKVAQNLLGAEVEEASLKLTDEPSCGESNSALFDSMLDQYDVK